MIKALFDCGALAKVLHFLAAKERKALLILSREASLCVASTLFAAPQLASPDSFETLSTLLLAPTFHPYSQFILTIDIQQAPAANM
jgi:hypothetical protein